MPTYNTSGKPTYMYQSSSDTWFAVGAKVDTAAGYSWTGAHAFANTVSFADAVTAKNWNNFLNPAARDAAIPTPVQGTLAFVRQNAGGTTINQLQYYNGTTWVANDGDISAVTAGTGLTGGGTAGAITLAIDTTVVTTLTGTQTLTNKDLTSATNTFPTSLVTLTGTQTLTGKTISGASNTLSNIGNSSLTNSSITINGTTVSLGGSATIQGESFSPFMLMGA